MKVYILSLLLFFSTTASACRPNTHSIKEFIASSEKAYEAVVTGIINSSMENGLNPDYESDEETIIFPYSYKLRVILTKSLRGNVSARIKTSNTFCSSVLDIGTKVFFFSNEDESDTFILTQEFLKDNYQDIYRKLSSLAQNKDVDKSR